MSRQTIVAVALTLAVVVVILVVVLLWPCRPVAVAMTKATAFERLAALIPVSRPRIIFSSVDNALGEAALTWLILRRGLLGALNTFRAWDST